MNPASLSTRAARLLVFAALAAALTLLTGCGRTPRPAATTTPSPSPSPDHRQAAGAIFDRYAEALGGQEAADRVETYALKGSFEVTGRPLKLPVEIYVKKPDMSLMVIKVPGLGEIRRGRSGGQAWVQTPFSARAQEDSPNELTEVERDHDLYKAGRIRELYREVRLEGKARLRGRDVYVVEGKPAEGPAEKMLFDTETGLLLRWDIVRRAPGRPNVFARVYLEDYREVDGLKVPFTVKYFFEPRELVLRLEDVKHGVTLDDSLFEKPAGR
jgi:outer membrane lipoprotein-sorting protein